MRTPLIERLSAGAPELARFDASVAGLEREFRHVGAEYAPRTIKAYARRYRRYVEWCAAVGYQTGPAFITAEKIREFTVHMTTVLRYAPKTVWQAIRALEIYAQRAGVLVDLEPALVVLDLWRDELAELGIEQPRRQRRPSRGA